jgi:pimeloyl-ACP methyl ester carboxylesterase
MTRPVLVIIPGIGDRHPVYTFFAWVWRRLGYETHVMPFGWSHYYADIGTKTRDFLYCFDTVTEKRQTYIIGISAGGTAAIHVYANRPYVQRVIAVSTPFADFEKLENRLLASSILTARQDMGKFDADEKANILSVYGLYDETVPTKMSRLEGVSVKRLWMVRHALIIFVALTIKAPRLRRFLRG